MLEPQLTIMKRRIISNADNKVDFLFLDYLLKLFRKFSMKISNC